MSEQDPKQSPGANAAGLNDAGGAPSEAATARTTEFLERGAEMAKPMAELGARNMEAFVASAKVAGRAAESLTREVTEYQRKNFEDAFAMARSFAEVRSPLTCSGFRAISRRQPSRMPWPFRTTCTGH
jgi:hypothetical protein